LFQRTHISGASAGVLSSGVNCGLDGPLNLSLRNWNRNSYLFAARHIDLLQGMQKAGCQAVAREVLPPMASLLRIPELCSGN